jgi:hypothetical protein
MTHLTIRRIIFTGAVTGLLLLGSGIPSRGQSQEDRNEKQQQATKAVSGKVSSIGAGGTSLTVSLAEGSSGQDTMSFVVDKNTQVKGQVKTGTPVTVEYQAMNDGQLLAVSITAQA